MSNVSDFGTQGTKQKKYVTNLKRRIREKRKLISQYEKELAEYEKTKKRKVPAKKYVTTTDESDSEDSDDGSVSYVSHNLALRFPC